jgi:hypothetical protein
VDKKIKPLYSIIYQLHVKKGHQDCQKCCEEPYSRYYSRSILVILIPYDDGLIKDRTYIFADPVTLFTTSAGLPHYEGGKSLPCGAQERHAIKCFIYFIIEMA